MRRLSSRPAVAFAAVMTMATVGLAACGGGGSSATSQGANADATAACAALVRSNPVNAGTIALSHRLQGAAELGIAAVGENGNTYSNLSGAFQKLLTDVTNDDITQLNGDVSNALALCKGDSLPH